ncbi:MAG: hypothetical protein SCK29_04810 [Bacillota bacterium]|nr:hypothetical protein [Bacillota bacterium]
MRTNFKILLGISLSLVLVFMTLGLTASANSPAIFNYNGSPEMETGISPGGNCDYSSYVTTSANTKWYKWDNIDSTIGDAIKDGTSYRFTISPAPDCDPNNLFVFAKA